MLGVFGIDCLNVLLQEIFNPNPDGKRKEIAFGDVKYRIGDKVLQLVNKPENNVFNGDIGEIISIIYAKENTEKQDMIYLSFEGNEVEYTKQELNQITHAYCCSVHKSQGSEFPIVILPITRSYYRMLQRNLIYTAITRSKQSLIICGEEDALRMGIERADELSRQTTLCLKLQESLPSINEKKEIPALETKATGELSYEEELMLVNPMVGMENVTPYDFMVND